MNHEIEMHNIQTHLRLFEIKNYLKIQLFKLIRFTDNIKIRCKSYLL